jgi:carbonic anhydrase
MQNENLIGRRRFFGWVRSPLWLRQHHLWWAVIKRGRSRAQRYVIPQLRHSGRGTPSVDKRQRQLGANEQVHPGEDPARRACLASNAQTPFASVLSCSDSRCPPELLFDQGLGDLFVARVAGNTASGRLIDSLLLGTEDLGTRLLFVLGHSSCGAVAAAVGSWPFGNPRLPFVNLILPAVTNARKIVKNNGGNPNDPAQVIPVATVQNVLLTVKELKTYFGLNSSQVKGGVYDLGTQLVSLVN